MRVLVTGAQGQLGSELEKLSRESGIGEFLFTDRESLDIGDRVAVESLCREKDIDAIVNCAAYTAVDRAEEEREAAERVNRQGVANLAHCAKEMGARFVHISTDYVFDGRNCRPYLESDPVSPQSVYGESKLAGEREVMEISPADTVVIRTSWVYSSFGSNFVKTMLRLGRERESLGVVFDQVGTPTYARDLAAVILEILPRVKNDAPELYHYSNEGVCSWYDFAVAIFEEAEIDVSVNPIESFHFPTPAKRPHYSVLDKGKIKRDFGLKIPYWRDSLREALRVMEDER